MNSFGQTTHKHGCPALLYPGSSCTCGEIKGPVATQLERIEQVLKGIDGQCDAIRFIEEERFERIEESQGKLLAAIDAVATAMGVNMNRLSGQLQGTADAIATALGEQSKKLQTIDTLATGLHIRWEEKFSKRKGRKRHGKRRK